MLLDRACGSNLALTIESSSDNNNFIIVMHYSESCLHTEEGPKKKKNIIALRIANVMACL